MDTLHFSQMLVELLFAVMTFSSAISVYFSRQDEPKRNGLLNVLLLLNTLLLLADAAALYFSGHANPFGFFLTRVSNFLVFAISPIIALIVTTYIIEILNLQNTRESSFWYHIIMILSAVDLAIIIGSQFTNFLYYFDVNNYYHRTMYFPVTVVLAEIIVFMIALMVFVHRAQITKPEMIALLSFIFLPLISSIYQFFHYGLSLNNIAITFSLLMLYMSDMIGKSHRLVRQQELLLKHEMELTQQKLALAEKDNELAETRIRVLISQMRPHFLFNALGSIEQLCRVNPVLAGDAIHKFSRYLRTNINALGSADLVYFNDELEHIRTYVWLEQMRFGDDIVYEEDLQTDSFRIPALSVQPLIENSIKHGLSGMEDGAIHIRLTTRETPSFYIIIVTDDGCGFDPDHPFDDGRVHVGLTNVKERIKLLTDGFVEIESIIDQGTTIRINIPKE
ncbi:MAG: histidine kinase [Lachnospiraceae bacterium]|nr:histidine kinase [Lachnospiraceae bacterium]